MRKLLIIIVLAFTVGSLRCQTNDTIARYIDSLRNPELTQQQQMYSYILAVDELLKQCTDYQTYKSVYQYLIYGFSEMGANLVVDYMMRLPYLESMNATAEQRNEIIELAGSFERVKIGQQAPDIHAVTIDKKELDLNSIEDKYVIILFWAYTCPHCQQLIKELSAFAKENHDFVLVTVSVSKEVKKVKHVLKKLRLNNAYNICDGNGWNSQIIDDYAVDMSPSMFLLDKNKVIIAKPFDVEEIITVIGL